MVRLLAMAYDWLLCRLGFTGDFSRFTFDATQVRLLAVALLRTSACTAHSGVAYRTAGGILRFLHFADHEELRDDVLRSNLGIGQNAFSLPLLKVEDQEFLAEFCGRVHRTNQIRKLPYSFDFDSNLGFDRDTGLVVGNHNQGFTCSTFVVALFRSAGNPLVQSITWPRSADSADIAARQYLLNWWRTRGNARRIARADEIEPAIQTMRISPEQTAGACLQKKLPTGYFRAKENGDQIQRRMSARSGRAAP